MGFVPRHAEELRDNSLPHHANEADAAGHRGRRRSIGPQIAERPHHSIGVGMKNALVPSLRALRKVWIVADGIDGRTQHAMLPWLGILRHEEDVALFFNPDLVHKLREAGGIGQVEVGVRLEAVPVAAGDEQDVPLLGQLPYGAIFIPVA